jgi:hypothetical protein
MSSSSRSIAAARQKRAGEQSQPMNTSRPVTSISSQGAFAQQYQQQMMAQNIPVGSKNVRLAQNKNQIQGGMNNNQKTQQQDQSTKISVSNAIGLITLRLGRLENLVSDAIDEGGFNNSNNNDNTENPSIPSNMKLVTDEVFENIVNRLNLIESKIINFTNQNEKLQQLVNEMTSMQTSIVALNSTVSSFINETNEKFVDYENALAEIENNLNFIPEQNVNTIMDENENVLENVLENAETMNDESITNNLESDKKSNENEITEHGEIN